MTDAHYTDEQLSAYLDGELSAEEMAAIHDEVEKGADIAERVKSLASADEAMRQAFSSIDSYPLPQKIQDLIETPAIEAPEEGLPVQKWLLPLAASLLLALALGSGFSLGLFGNAEKPNMSLHAADRIEAGHPLFSLLETGPSAKNYTLEDESTFRSLATFKTKSGDYCREFKYAALDKGVHGVACRALEAWQVEIIVADNTAMPTSDFFTPATEAAHTALEQYINARLVGTTLNISEEEALIARQWAD